MLIDSAAVRLIVRAAGRQVASQAEVARPLRYCRQLIYTVRPSAHCRTGRNDPLTGPWRSRSGELRQHAAPMFSLMQASAQRAQPEWDGPVPAVFSYRYGLRCVIVYIMSLPARRKGHYGATAGHEVFIPAAQSDEGKR